MDGSYKTDAELIANGKELLTAAFKEKIIKVCQELEATLPTQIDASGVPNLELTLQQAENHRLA